LRIGLRLVIAVEVLASLFLRGVYSRVLVSSLCDFREVIAVGQTAFCVSSRRVSKQVCNVGRPVVAKFVGGSESEAASLARGQHVPDDADQSSILHCGCDALFITELLVDSISGGVGAFLQAHVDTEAWWESVLQAHTHSQSDDGTQTAVGSGRREQDSDSGDARSRTSRCGDENIRQVYDRKTGERVWVLGVLDGGDEVVDFLRVYLLTWRIIFVL
jgi:hypothetical protein